MHGIASGASEGEEEADGQEADLDLEERHELELLRAEFLVPKFQKWHRSLELSSLGAFSHTNYTVDPIEGEIWPRGSKELTFTFAPDHASASENDF
jgi:hypothetical protein